MGKLKVVKAGMMVTIQDKGRFGYRRYGIPQSGAMDPEAMLEANRLTGNPADYPVIELAMSSLELTTLESTVIAVTGSDAEIRINGKRGAMYASHQLNEGDELKISTSKAGVYTCLGMGGKIDAREEFGSFSTYVMAGFGGLAGGPLKKGDIIRSGGSKSFRKRLGKPSLKRSGTEVISILKGPEWHMLKESPDLKTFEIDASSNRMGIRLKGATLAIDGSEIKSSAVIPGTIQLPSGGSPIILMNDCQTTGGYPRIGKVVDEDLGRLAQLRAGSKIRFEIK